MTDPVKELRDMMLGSGRTSQEICFQARIVKAKGHIAELQRFKRLTGTGLSNLKAKLKWWDTVGRIRCYFYFRSYHLGMVPRVEKLCAEWERVIKFPNNMIFEIAKKEQAQFEKDYGVSWAMFQRLPNTDSAEM